MRKKTKFKSHILDFLVVLCGLSVALFFLFLFWKDLNSSIHRTDKDSIATIYFKNRIAQRKFNDRVVWERISTNSPVYNDDMIRTAELASATIKFKDGNVIDIFENTMIQISYTEGGGLEIDIDGGNINIESGGENSVALKMNDGSVVNVDSGASVEAHSSSTGAKSVEVKTGTAKLISENGQSAELNSGESASVQKDGQFQKNLITVVSLPKEMKILNLNQEDVNVTLEWKVNENATEEKIPVRVQTSYKKDFSEIASEQVVTGNSTQVKSDGGAIYWRVFAEDSAQTLAEEIPSATGKIAVEKVPPLELLSPTTSSEFSYRNSLPKVTFRWNGNDWAEHYKILVYKNPDMSQVAHEFTTKASFLSVSDLEQGTYWWKVVPFYSLNSIGYNGESDLKSFKITKIDQINPPTPTLPAQNASIAYKKGETLPLRFAWKSDIKNADYKILISRDENFSELAYSESTNATSKNIDLASQNLAAGTYWWKIIRTAVDLNELRDDLTPESIARSFTVVNYVPGENKLLYPKDAFAAEKEKLAKTQFVWKLSDDYKNFDSVIQISSSKDFSSIQFEKTVSAPYIENISLEEGSYWWRIGVEEDDGTKTAFTSAYSFTILKELEKPQIIWPKPNETAITYSGFSSVFSWNKVDGADYYNIKIFDEKDSLVAQKEAVKTNTFSTELSPGSYEVKIQAVADETENSFMRVSPVALNFFSLRSAVPVAQDLPRADSNILGLEAVRKPTVFSWHPEDDKADSYTFVLKKRQTDGSFKTVEKFKSSKNSVSVTRLLSGSYKWQILASTNSGAPINSDERSFTVQKIPDLKKPALSEPSDKTTMTSDYFRKNRSINFEWKDSPGANTYNFSLYKKNSDGSLQLVHSEKSIKTTKFRFKELTSLDTGDFVWNVTAFSYAKDGFEEQHSPAATSSFKISFASPSKIETVEPEKMYSE